MLSARRTAARTLRMPHPESGSLMNNSCGLVWPTRFTAAVHGGVLEGDVGLSPAGGASRVPRPAATCAAKPAPSGRAEERVTAPRLIKGCARRRGGGGKEGQKEVSCSRERGAVSRGGWALPICTRGQAPALGSAVGPQLAGTCRQLPLSHRLPPAAVTKPSCPQTSAEAAALRPARRPGGDLLPTRSVVPASPETAPE